MIEYLWGRPSPGIKDLGTWCQVTTCPTTVIPSPPHVLIMHWHMQYKCSTCVGFYSNKVQPCLCSCDSCIVFYYLFSLGTLHIRTDRADVQGVCRDMSERWPFDAWLLPWQWACFMGNLALCIDSFVNYLHWPPPSQVFYRMIVFFFFNKVRGFLYVSRMLALFYIYDKCRHFPTYFSFSFTLFWVSFYARC